MASNPSREVLRGRLLHKTKGGGWKKRVVIANCGSSATKKQLSAQLQLFEDYEKVEKHGTKPKKTVELSYAKVSAVSAGSPSGSQTNSPAGAVTGVSISPSPSPSPRNSLTLSTSPSIHSLSLQSGTSHRFLVITSNETHEFRTETENDRLRWVKLLGLLVMFPFSVIPEEPQSNPIKESFRCKLDPVQYRADSVWAVYILPEEVGSRCTIIGMNVLALQSGVPNKTVGRLSIFSPADPSNPVLSWDRDKMRRTGKTGNLVFIEIGRRCQGGPGLVWMYAGVEEAQALRETLHNFLFHGDGKAVAIPTQQANPIYDIPRASFDSSFPPSYQRQGSISTGYQQHKFSSQDSGIMSPGAMSVDEPPPVHLDKHPSFRKKRSAPCDMPGRKGSYHSHDRSPDENSTRNNSNPSMQSADSLLNEETLFQHQESSSPPSRGSVTPPDCGDENSYADSESIMGHMDPDLDEPMPHVRSNTEPALGSRKQVTLGNRAHSTASCEPSRRGEYEKMTHPHAALYRNGYEYMKPNLDEVVQESHYASPRSIPVPYAQLQQHLHQPQPDDVYQRLQHFPSKPGPDVSRRNVQAYDRLPPIKETQIAERNRGSCKTTGIEKEKARAIAPRVPMPSESCEKPSKAEEKSSSRGEEKPSMYENHPLPAHLKNISQVIYKPSYENVNLAHAGRRGSQNQEPYENVTPSGEKIPAEPPTRPIHLIKKGSLRKGRGDKEDVVLPLNGNGLSISGKEVKSPSPPRSKNGYIDVETALVGDRPNHAMRPVAYTSIDLQSTDGFQNIKRERAEQKALVES